jgi:hypothetical protein
MGKCDIFEVLSNRLSITKIVVLIDKTVEHLFKRSSAYLFKPDRKQITDRRLNRSLVNDYPGRLLSVCKRIGWCTFSGRQFDKAL